MDPAQQASFVCGVKFEPLQSGVVWAKSRLRNTYSPSSFLAKPTGLSQSVALAKDSGPLGSSATRNEAIEEFLGSRF